MRLWKIAATILVTFVSASALAQTNVLFACADNRSGDMRIVSSATACTTKERLIQWTSATTVAALIEPPAPGSAGFPVPVLFTPANAVFDTGNLVATNQFVISQAGVYLITLFGVNQQDSSFMALYYLVNGALISSSCFSLGTVGAYPHCNGSELVQLNAGDTVSFHVYTNTPNVGRLRFGISKQ
jgi:hypothetical protein